MNTETLDEDLELVRMIHDRYNGIENMFFIQIGSNDGKTGDPIYRFVHQYNWRGILIEPVSYLFEKLKENYKNRKDCYFENVAISNSGEPREFYRLRFNEEPAMPFWYDQLGSFNIDVLLKHKHQIPHFDEYFVVDKVNCLSFEDLVAKYNIRNLDLLHIDTEGFDFEIMRQIPFASIKPKMILYEHQHLSESDNNQCAGLLEQNGYLWLRFLTDTLAYL